MTFGERLGRHLKAAGVSQAELARRIEVPPSSVTDWIKGDAYPRHQNLEKIAEALEMDLAKFFGEIGDNEEDAAAAS